MKPENTPSDLAFERTGRGQPLLLLHGFLEDGRIWADLARNLKQTRDIIVPDLPGHGRSPVLHEVHSMELMADSVVAVLDKLQLERVTVIGHSMGGYVALAMAERWPERLSGLVLLNSTPEADSPERRHNRDRALKLIEQDQLAFIRQAIPALFPASAIRIHRETIDQLVDRAIEFPLSGIRAAIMGMRDRADRTEVLKDFGRGKLWIAGRLDALIPISRALSVAEQSKTPIEILEGGHMSWTENPSILTNIVHFID
jgi:pimeloyl-ACP methyl ester carboxylesterase